MKRKISRVWYASYGSNMLKERFLCYINGGTPKGALRTYSGCSIKTHPLKDKPIEIHGEMYFARSSKTWHRGGICFLNPNAKNKRTLGRMYLIEPEQFTDLVKQESRYEGEMNIDFEKTIREGFLIIPIRSWYGRLLFLGFEEGHPVFTFTNEAYLESEFNPPHHSYVNMIKNGLMETYGMSEEKALQYLESKQGFIQN